ncbi:unannotated protein [freshwater metagenome]|uniref:Unannotated protein n=1 Tax=freshwater metagenome TaxID=449393 RepID=A0A6J6H8S1_9ZZZZ
MLNCLLRIDELNLANCFVERAEAKSSKEFTDFLGDELEEVHNELRLAGEAGPKLWILRCDSNRAGIEMADTHHDAA